MSLYAEFYCIRLHVSLVELSLFFVFLSKIEFFFFFKDFETGMIKDLYYKNSQDHKDHLK